MKENVLRVFTTARDTRERLQEGERQQFAESKREQDKNLLVLYPDIRYQEIIGFGGGITEAAGYVWSRLGDENRKRVLDAYYGKKGIGYTLCRSHIQSCDFCMGNYAYVSKEDDQLTDFNLERDQKYLIPLIKQACITSGNQLKLIGSPWSPPAFMKDNKAMNGGGKLKLRYYDLWAKTIARYVHEYRKMGIPVWGLTIQNEVNTRQNWESCVMTADEERQFAVEYLRPALKEVQASDVELYFWDHSKESVLDRTIEFMYDKKEVEGIQGVAVHWYAGDHFDALRMVKERYPGLKLISTEACVNNYTDNPSWEHAERYAHDVIGGLSNFLSAFIDWNIMLDETGGPTHIHNFCNAPVIAHVDRDELEFRASYYYLGHFSKFIRPGAVRIGSSCYTSDLETVAFLNKDGTIAVEILNRTDNKIPLSIKCGGRIADFISESHSMKTILFTAD